MKYRVDLDISFNTEDEALAFVNFIEELKEDTYEDANQENIPQRAKFHTCNHDAIPPLPCTDTVHLDFSVSADKHKNKNNKKPVYKDKGKIIELED